jgi:hypothetical protein
MTGTATPVAPKRRVITVGYNSTRGSSVFGARATRRRHAHMRGWIILIVALLVGAGLGAAGTVYGPPVVDPYLPKDLRIRSRIVEGQVTKKQRESNRVLVKIETQQGVILAAFTKRMAEIDLLIEPGDTIALALPGDQPFADDPSIERVTRPK